MYKRQALDKAGRVGTACIFGGLHQHVHSVIIQRCTGVQAFGAVLFRVLLHEVLDSRGCILAGVVVRKVAILKLCGKTGRVGTCLLYTSSAAINP